MTNAAEIYTRDSFGTPSNNPALWQCYARLYKVLVTLARVSAVVNIYNLEKSFFLSFVPIFYSLIQKLTFYCF